MPVKDGHFIREAIAAHGASAQQYPNLASGQPTSTCGVTAQKRPPPKPVSRKCSKSTGRYDSIVQHVHGAAPGPIVRGTRTQSARPSWASWAAAHLAALLAIYRFD